MKKLKNLLFKNFGYKLLSLFLAAVLWFVVVQIEDPKDSKTYSNIPVKIINSDLLEKENKVYEILDNSDVVTVTVRAPKSLISQVRVGDIVAEADMSKLTDINTIAITYSIQNVDVDYSITGNHDVVKLNVEERGSRWIDVKYSTVGEVAEGYMVTNVTSDQTMIEVSGPKSIVETIDYAAVEIDVTGASSNRTANVDIALFDREGNIISQNSISKNVERVHLSAEILATKEVPIETGYLGTPDKNYLVTGPAECIPGTVKLAGTPAALANITKIVIPDDKVNIAGAKEKKTEIVNIKELLPENVKLADSSFNGKVAVTVYIEEIKKKDATVIGKNVRTINVPNGYEIEVPDLTETYSLTISGLEEDISQIDVDNIIAFLDIEEWMSDENIDTIANGIYYIPAKFIFSGTSISHSDVKVRVSIVKSE